MKKFEKFEKFTAMSLEKKQMILVTGGWTATGGGRHQVFMQSFNYGCDSTQTVNGKTTTRFHNITNSTMNNGSGAHPGPC